MNMIHLAGDCVIPAIGQVFKGDKHIGFIMTRKACPPGFRLAEGVVNGDDDKGSRQVTRKEYHSRRLEAR